MSEALDPLELLWEPGGLPSLDLPEALAALYPGTLGFAGPTLFVNFVETIDGVVALPSLPNSNKLVAAASEADRFVMGLLRAVADVVVIGAGTMQAAPRSTWTAERAYPPAAEAFAALRRALGRPPTPELAFLTASGRLDPAHPALESGALVLTTAGGEQALRGRLPDASEAVVVNEGDLVDVRAAVDLLRGRGHELVLSEGGPTVLGMLLEAEVVDELFLTVSPLVAGRGGVVARLSLVEGIDLLPERRVAAHVLGVRLHGDHLFLRYGLR